RPGASLSPWKTPCVFVRKCSVIFSPAVSDRTSTVAPSCGVPAASRTCPEMFPAEGLLFAWAEAGPAPKNTLTTLAKKRPTHRSGLHFTSYYLPGAGATTAAVLGSAGGLIENSAEREIV